MEKRGDVNSAYTPELDDDAERKKKAAESPPPSRVEELAGRGAQARLNDRAERAPRS